MESHVRNGFSAVRPYVFGPLSLVSFVENALGGVVLARHEQGENARHIEVQVGDSVVVLELADPPHEIGFPGSIYVYVEDVDVVVRAAAECDVEVFAAAEDKPYEERQAGLRDSYGNVWWVATYTGE